MKLNVSGLANLVTVIVSSLVGFVGLEAGYRGYLYKTAPYHFVGDGSLWYFQASPYKYSEEFGFEYVPGSYSGGAIHESRVIECWDRMEEWEVNELGNSGRVRGSYRDAKIKILAFGDSFTQRAKLAPDGDYMTWPNYLQDLLEQEMGTSVHVMNFGRDAYGVLQMFDLASVKVRELQPDLAIIAFISDDLNRSRFWRTTTSLDGRQRILTSKVPDPNPNWETATDAYLLESKATKEWCHARLESGSTDDPIVRELEHALRDGRRRSTLLADPFSLTQSYLLDQIIHGNAYYSTYAAARPSQLPRHDLTDFAEDKRLVSEIAALRQIGVPYVLIHLATYREMSKGDEYADLPGARPSGLLGSLARLTGQPIRGTLEYADVSIQNLEAVPMSANDNHPSLHGHQVYAKIIRNILQHNGYLEVAKGRANAAHNR